MYASPGSSMYSVLSMNLIFLISVLLQDFIWLKDFKHKRVVSDKF